MTHPQFILYTPYVYSSPFYTFLLLILLGPFTFYLVFVVYDNVTPFEDRVLESLLAWDLHSTRVGCPVLRAVDGPDPTHVS